MEVVIYYETSWIAKGENLYLTASSLLELRDKIKEELLSRKHLESKKVTLIFDRMRMPHWVVSHLSVESTELTLTS
ncbi:DUF5395 family protein [Thermodesulfatator atlanticus]|uniref:DUF5395 family protein n=1 Tax=Thermodesulfatator atlanticus TaxID=501497 RepID=UPI0003B479AD|nr:DUF5395 family protein [Thermodesulfatator atlanticus]